MARRIQVDVWTKDGRHEQSTKSREDADFYNNLPFESENVLVTRVVDVDD